jgi:hypothetical protein
VVAPDWRRTENEMVTRMMPPIVGNSSHRVNGRLYVGVVGQIQDVNDWDAAMLAANNWISLGQIGPSTARPANPPTGTVFNDTTTMVPVVFDGKSWRHSQTGAVV